MNIQFSYVVEGQLKSHTSPDFPDVSQEKLDEFYDWCGGTDADCELFWESDISQDDDTILVGFFQGPKDPQRVVSVLGTKLGINIASFSDWHTAVDRL